MTRGVSIVTRALVIVLLARLLTPADYGVAGMALVVTSFAMILTDPALGAALIQRPTIDERDRSTVFWIAAGIGAMLTILGVGASGVVADFFGEDQVQNLFIATSFCFFPISLSVVHRALLARKLAYRSLEIRDMIATVTGGAIAVVVAIAGFGAWAVVANFIAYSLTSTVLVWLLMDWRPRAVFSTDRAHRLSGFSMRIFAATILSWGTQNLDKVLVGRFLGAPALGAYSLAYSAMFLPMNLLGGPFHQVVGPVFSRIQGDTARLERAWLRSKRLSIAIVAPGMLVLVVVAPDFVPLVFGETWDDAVVPLQLLCLGGLASSLTNLHWSVLQARGEAAAVLRLTVVSSVLTISAFVAGLHWGIVGVAAFYAAARWLYVVPSTLITTRAVSFDFWRTLRAGAGMLPAAIAAAAVAAAERQLLLETALPQYARLALVSAGMVLAYAAIVLVFSPAVASDIKNVVERRADGSAPHSQPT